MINKFNYIDIVCLSEEDIEKYKLNLRLADTEAKHIVYPWLHEDMVELSSKVGYDYLIIGSHRCNSRTESEKERINNMKNTPYKRPARFVISRDGRVWADNTHWTVSYILNDPSALIKDIPAYIVDFREEIPTVVSINNSVYDSVICIKNAILSAYSIQERLNKGWRPLPLAFKISDLINELFE